jgi:hypothetical protein
MGWVVSVAANILSKHLQTDDNLWLTSLELGIGAENTSPGNQWLQTHVLSPNTVVSTSALYSKVSHF